MSTKNQREIMGTLTAAIVGATVLSKPLEHDFGGKKGVAWVIITPEGQMVKATTYDGNLGKKFNLGDHNVKPAPAPETKEYRYATKGYSPVTEASQLPQFITLAESTTGATGEGDTEEAEAEEVA